MRYDAPRPADAVDGADAGALAVAEARDLIWVMVDGRPVGRLSRALHERGLSIPRGARLTLLVEDQGRVNYDHRLGEPKGPIAPVTLNGRQLRGWGAEPGDLAEVAARVSGSPSGPAVGRVALRSPTRRRASSHTPHSGTTKSDRSPAPRGRPTRASRSLSLVRLPHEGEMMNTMTATARHTTVSTTLGELLLVAEGDALAGIYFPQHTYPPKPEALGERVDEASDPFFADLARQLREYLAGERTVFEIPIATSGDAFSEKVWAILREIPYGTTITYGAIAERLGGRGLAQRVGPAVGHNPISIVVPCHRVVGADGSLTGFAGGLSRKRTLLELEEPSEASAARLF